MDNALKLTKYECACCDKSFILSKKQVEDIEKIAKIKCPYCGQTDHIIEITIDD